MTGPEEPGAVPEQKPLRRYLLRVEYDGTRYSGLQRQDHTTLTIQQAFEDAAARLGVQECAFTASGRTDAGVHAAGQVMAMDLPAGLPAPRISRTMNALLPEDIRVREAAGCPPEFSPRFDARQRTYLYRLCALEPVPPLHRNRVAFVKAALDPELARAAAAAFVGRWELAAWRSSICQATRTLLTIDECEALPPRDDERTGEHQPWWTIRVRARSFLHHQVRFMAGAVVAAGSGKLPVEELREALAEGRRPVCVTKLPACGLCLLRVEWEPGVDPFR